MQNDNFQPMPLALKILVGIIVIIELAASASDYGYLAVDQLRGELVLYAGLWPQLVTQGWEGVYPGQQLVMFISHAFVHGSIFHMAMNCAVLLGLGKQLSIGIGPKWLLILFTVSAIGGGILFVAINTSGAPAVGASGAVFGFFGFWKAMQYKMLRRTGGDLTPILTFIGALVVMNVILWFGFGGLLAWEAHLGGFIAGWILGITYRTRAEKWMRKANGK